jgi:iron complex outermembrane receptor protein
LGRHLCLPLSLLTVLGAGQGAAQEPSEEDLLLSFGDEEFVSIATGRRQLISKAPSVATVVTAKDIEEMGAVNLDEVLESVPGLHVALSSVRFNPVYIIRGIYSDTNPEILFLVNGVPMTQLYLGDRGDRSTLPVRSIQRIEVIRGPGSAVYGADAFSGVVNIITKSSEDIDGVEVGGRVASFDTTEAWLLGGGGFGDVDVAFTLEGFQTDGDSDRVIDSDAQTVFDNAIGTTASLAPDSADTQIKRLDARLELDYSAWKARAWYWAQRDARVGPGLAQALDDQSDGETDNFLGEIRYDREQLFSGWDLAGYVSYMHIDGDSRQNLYPPGAILPIGPDGNISPSSSDLVLFTDGVKGNPGKDEDHWRFDLVTSFTNLRGHRLRYNVGYYYARFEANETKNFGPGVIEGIPGGSAVDGSLTDVTNTPFVYAPDESRKNVYASIQDEWKLAPDWNLTAGLRYDWYSDFGSTVNPRLALVWNSTNDLTTKFLYGRAFRAPAFLELYAQNNPVLIGNEDVDPETINMFELAFDYRPLSDLQGSLSFFAYRIDDRIEFVPNAALTERVADNVGEQDGYGLELEGKWDVTRRLEIEANYAYQNTDVKDANSDVPVAPKHQVYIDGKWEFIPRVLLSTQVNWVGERSRAAGDPRENVDDYTWVNAAVVATDLWGRVGITVGVKNLFDVSSESPSPFEADVPGGAFVPGDYPLEGRSYFVQGKVGF